MFVDLFIRRPILSTVLSLVIILAGAASIPTLPIAQYPELAPPQVSVTSIYTGANAQAVESAVTIPIEQAINGAEGMLYMTSTSTSSGVSTVTATFNVDRNQDLAAVDVQNRVPTAQGRLPNEVKNIGVTVTKASAGFIMAAGVYAEGGQYDSLFLSNYLDVFVRDALKRVPGVADVIIFGERKYAMRLWLDPTRLASRGITAADVTGALREQNVQVAAGSVGQPPIPSGQLYQISVRAAGRLSEPSEFENIIVKAGTDGTLIRLKDIGRAELGAETYSSVVPPDEREAHRGGLAPWTADDAPGGILDTRIELTAQNASGARFPVEIAFRRLSIEGPPLFTAWIRDLRDLTLGEERLRAAELRYRTLVEQLPLVVYVDAIDAVSSNLYTSPQVEPLLGYSPAEWEKDPDLFVRLLHPDDRERVLAAHARTHDGSPLSIEYRLIARDGHVVWVHDEARPIVGASGAPVALQGYLLDITAAKEAEEQLRHQAFHDPLTGLPNRTLFQDRALAALAATDGTAEAAMLLLDIDDFKAINDRFGHVEADMLLHDIGTRLRDALPDTVVVARLGGDEFAVLLDPSDDPAGIAVRSAGALIDALRTPFAIAGIEMFVTTSVGIALGTEVDQLFRRADVAMYRAKSAGKAQYALYAPWMDDAVLGRLELLGELRQARPGEDFLLHYQPVLELATERVVGVEALLRWRHPTRGIVQPADFIPIAEESGLIVPLGRWVLAQACGQVASWRDLTPDGQELTVSVNVSARQLQHPDFVHDVRVALDAAALDPRRLVLEITENVVIGDHVAVGEMLEALQLMGVRLALDDFGVGYSSLSMLESLPFDALKLDRVFVSRLGASSSSAPLVRAIADLGTALELDVIAEGIENEVQMTELRRLGVRRGQGTFFANPLEARQVEQLLRDGHTTRPYAA